MKRNEGELKTKRHSAKLTIGAERLRRIYLGLTMAVRCAKKLHSIL
jgi:hypothetical protein